MKGIEQLFVFKRDHEIFIVKRDTQSNGRQMKLCTNAHQYNLRLLTGNLLINNWLNMFPGKFLLITMKYSAHNLLIGALLNQHH